MFVLAGSHPPCVPPTRSVTGCQRSSARLHHPLAAGRLRRRAAVRRRLCRPSTLRPRRLHRLAGMDQSSAARRWSMAGRPTAMSIAAASPSAASRSPARSATTGEAAAIPLERPHLEQAVVGRVRRLDDEPFRQSAPADFPRDGRHGGYLAALYDRQQQRAAAPPSCCTRPTNIRPSPATSSAPARPARPGAMPIRAPRGGASTAPPTIATSSPTCAAATCRPIGGNVKNSVTMSLYPVDSRGRLVPFAGKTWFMVVEKRV